MSSLPSSRSESTTIATKLFVIEQMRKAVSASGAEPDSRSRTPQPPECTSSPSIATPYAMPGAPSSPSASAKSASMSGARGAHARRTT